MQCWQPSHENIGQIIVTQFQDLDHVGQLDPVFYENKIYQYTSCHVCGVGSIPHGSCKHLCCAVSV